MGAMFSSAMCSKNSQAVITLNLQRLHLRRPTSSESWNGTVASVVNR